MLNHLISFTNLNKRGANIICLFKFCILQVSIFTVKRTYAQNLTDVVYSLLKIVDKLDGVVFIKTAINVVNDTHRVEKKTIQATFLGYFLGDSTGLFSLINERFPELGLRKFDCTEHSWIEYLNPLFVGTISQLEHQLKFCLIGIIQIFNT